jgi:uncharacterized membrane protein SirB2
MHGTCGTYVAPAIPSAGDGKKRNEAENGARETLQEISGVTCGKCIDKVARNRTNSKKELMNSRFFPIFILPTGTMRMYPIHISLLLHFIGIGLLFTSLCGGWILHRQYRKAADWSTKVVILNALRPLGLLSPVAIAVMIVSGIGNMHLSNLGLFSAPWLSIKLVVFVIAVVAGIVAGVRGKRRSAMALRMAAGEAAGGTAEKIRALDRQLSLSMVFQALLLLVILLLSIVKPHA